MIEYETGIPVPEHTRNGGRKVKYPLGEMPVGASFFVPGKKPGQVSGSFQRHVKNGRKFTARTVTENGIQGIRVWRIK